MKLECEADRRCFVEVVDVWTRRMVREYGECLNTEDEAGLHAFYQRVVKNVHLIDADGNEIDGLDAVLEFDAGEGMDNVDSAVTTFWATFPYQAYRARQELGNAKRVS